MKTHPLVAGLTLALASTLCLTGCSTSAHEDDAQSSSTATTAQPVRLSGNSDELHREAHLHRGTEKGPHSR